MQKLRPFLMVWRARIGSSTASIASGMFSMMIGSPFWMANSTWSRYFGVLSCTTLQGPLSPFPSRSKIQPMPCSCGSIISGHRAQLVMIAPFWIDTSSAGSFSMAQLA